MYQKYEYIDILCIMRSVRVSIAVWSALSGSVGYWLGHARKDESGQENSVWGRFISAFPSERTFITRLVSSENDIDKVPEDEVPAWYQYLPVPYKVSASSAPLERNNLPSTVPAHGGLPTTPTNRVVEIMKFGYPNLDNIRFYEDYVVSYDRRNRTAFWVFEHIRGEHCEKKEGVVRNNDFKEDQSVHPFFRSTNADYKGSGYDRGHLAAASNHRYSQKAMDMTFMLSNISPQVGNSQSENLHRTSMKMLLKLIVIVLAFFQTNIMSTSIQTCICIPCNQ